MEQSLKKSGEKQGSPMIRVASFIVDKRMLFFLLYILITVFSLFSSGWVGVENDLSEYLSETTETRQGLTIMEDEFVTYASADVMISNITYEIAEKLAAEIRNFEHVTEVVLDDSPMHFVNSSALLSISFDGEETDPDIIAEMDHIRELLADYDTYISSQIGYDYSKELAGEMGGVLAITVAVILAVLLFTSRSYFEVVIFIIVFAVAALMNMGTNYLLGEISSITNSIAVILQLALAIDYAIILYTAIRMR